LTDPRHAPVASRSELNELFEPFEIALDSVFDDVELVPYILDQTLRLVLECRIDPGLPTAYVFECDGASIRGPLSGCPRNLWSGTCSKIFACH
jgi:hypothetical protein